MFFENKRTPLCNENCHYTNCQQYEIGKTGLENLLIFFKYGIVELVLCIIDPVR